MIILFQNILFSKEFPACNGCFELFTKIKEKSGTSSWCIFSTWFFHKNVPYLILYLWAKVSMPYLSSFSRYQTKYVIMFLFRQLMKNRTLTFQKNCVICFIENPLKMMKNIFYFILKALFILKQLCWFFNMTKKLLQKLKYLENEKSFWSWRHNLVTKQLQ